jgi:hypothetical protein
MFLDFEWDFGVGSFSYYNGTPLQSNGDNEDVFPSGGTLTIGNDSVIISNAKVGELRVMAAAAATVFAVQDSQ